ncbi:MAG: NarK family nitrate/nitrite MFS transporter [Hyphomicrobiaceae bacterium]|nr:NarK family nitrate/nitrite MFS transporter [Hyphomicrobiaceae bacterium]
MSSPNPMKLNLFALSEPKIRILHFTWGAFFVSFLVWFNMAPLLGSIREALGLTSQEVKTLLILNLALTIPARVIIGMLVDKFGPKITFSSLLVISSFLCFAFALAQDFQTLALTRFLLGFVGAGFVIGIRMISEWFPARQTGLAQGIYGGWGNFGSAGAAISLPLIALWIGGEDGWRYAVGLTGVIALIYGIVFYFSVSDTPKGSTYFKPKKVGALEISSPGDFVLYCLMQAPIFLALGVLVWKLSPINMNLLGAGATYGLYAFLLALYGFQVYQIFKINGHVLKTPVSEMERYSFKQVAVLELAYMVTFGSELAVVSMLPLFYTDVFKLDLITAGLLASAFAFTNLVARPGGGLLSDKFGRKKTLWVLLAGMVIAYIVLSQVTAAFWLPLVVAITMACSFLGQAGSGAVFAMVPLIKRRMTGQIGGLVGAYGNVGGVLFLTVLSFVAPKIFFLTIAAAILATLLFVLFFLDEPSGQMTEVLPDGTVEMIDVN